MQTALRAASRSRRLQTAAEGSTALLPLVRRFVGGEEPTEVAELAASLGNEGLRSTLDVLGEDVEHVDDAEATVAGYLAVLNAVAARRPEGAASGDVEVSVKLSALGSKLPQGESAAWDRTATICRAAADIGTTVTLDMEDHTTTDRTLAALAELRQEHPGTGVAVQAALFRTVEDCRLLSEGGTRVRLCKGAYREPAPVSHQKRADIDASYRRCLQVLMTGDGYPMVATHDPGLIAEARSAAERAGRDAARWEYQMLHGVRSDEQRRLAAEGFGVRVYVPFGRSWSAYLLRRVAERPANIALLGRAVLSKR